MHTQLRRLFARLDNGAWGDEPIHDGSDIRCIRAADFDSTRFRVNLANAPLRRIDPPRRQRLLLRRGDLVLEKSGGGEKQVVGRAVLYDADADAVCSNFAARIRPQRNVDPRYLTYLLAALYYEGATARCVLQTTGIQNLDTDAWLATDVPVVTQENQRHIADFLDNQVARIDGVRMDRQKQIQLLKAAYQAETSALLRRASTSLVKVRYLVTKIGSGKTPRGGAEVYQAEGVKFLRSQNIHNGGLRLDDVAYISPLVDEEMRSTRVAAGDVLLNITGASLGRCTTAPHDVGDANVSQHVCILRPLARVDATVLTAAICDDETQDQIRLMQVGGNRDGLNFEQVAALRVHYPDSGAATADTRDALAKTQSSYEALADDLRQNIIQLDALRRSLINEAIGGEFDVSSAHGSRVLA